MFDRIDEKVKEIRQQPENIRIRYVWGAVIITMFIVIFIWVISLKINFLQMNTDQETQESIDELKERIDSINSDNPINNDSISIDELLKQSPTDSEI